MHILGTDQDWVADSLSGLAGSAPPAAGPAPVTAQPKAGDPPPVDPAAGLWKLLGPAEQAIAKPTVPEGNPTLPKELTAILDTPAVQQAIEAETLRLYYAGAQGAVAAQISKTIQVARAWLARVFAWHKLRAAVYAAHSEAPLTQGAWEQAVQGVMWAQSAIGLFVPGSDATVKGVGEVANQILKIKDLEQKLAKLQTSAVCKWWVGADTFDLKFEKLVYWLGPVPVRARVAQKDAKGGLTFPIPANWLGTQKAGGWNPPLGGGGDWQFMPAAADPVWAQLANFKNDLLVSFDATTPGLADLLPFAAYSADGVDDKPAVNLAAVVSSPVAAPWVAERLGVKGPTAAVWAPTLNTAWRWGELYQKQGKDTDPGKPEDPTGWPATFAGLVAKVRAVHNATRQKAAPLLQEIANLRNEIGITVASATGIPPMVPVWKEVGGVFAPSEGRTEWAEQLKASGVVKLGFDVYAKQIAGLDTGLTFDNFLAPGHLQEVFVAQYDKGLPLVAYGTGKSEITRQTALLGWLGLQLQAISKAPPATSGLSADQKLWVDARAGVKSNLLLAALYAKLGLDRAENVAAIVGNLKLLADALYGVSIPPPPKGLPPSQWADYYAAEFKKAADNPAPGSKLGKCKALLAEITKQKTLAQAGDPDAAGKLAALEAELQDLQAEVGALAGERRSRRNTVARRLGAHGGKDGGTSGAMEASAGSLATAGSLAGKAITIAGVSVKVGLTPGEKQLADNAAKDLKDLEAKHNDAGAYASGAGAGLQEVGKAGGFTLPPGFGAQIGANVAALTTVLPEKKRGGLPWWVVALGVVAAVKGSRG